VSSSNAHEALAPYHRKRDFKKTPEPRTGGTPANGALSFVVQKHHASRLHYDFRLELDGTLKSWAVPKGPCLDPTVKRMAVHVEDHPISYASFEGTIPPKQYGAGTVIVWDRGEWAAEGDARKALAEGKLKFELRGDFRMACPLQLACQAFDQCGEVHGVSTLNVLHRPASGEEIECDFARRFEHPEPRGRLR